MEHKKGKTIVPTMWGTMILFPVLSLVFIGLRLYCRRWLKKATTGHLDDYVLIFSWVRNDRSNYLLKRLANVLSNP